MKNIPIRARNLIFLSLLCLALTARAQTGVVFTTLYSFTGTNDGANPQAALTLGRDGYLYGATDSAGGNLHVSITKGTGKGPALITNSYYGSGTIFKISPSGALSTLYVFGPITNQDYGPLDGANPRAALTLGADGNFYGTTYAGGAYGYGYGSLGVGGYGTVFQITTNGVLTNLHSFTDTNDGACPAAALVQASDGNFYGTTEGNPENSESYGSVFTISTNGTLVGFPFTEYDGFYGINPEGGLVEGGDGFFYGATRYGGLNLDDGAGYGTLFKISANGALTSFSFNGSAGVLPAAGLIHGLDGFFYGTTAGGRGPGGATIFRIGTNLVPATLYVFGLNPADGSSPNGGLVQGSDGVLYGTAGGSDTNFNSTVFKINPDGSGFTTLHTFATNGLSPEVSLILNGNTLYGTTSRGGAYGYGAVFSLTLPGPQLTLTASAGNIALSWPTNASNLTLQFTTNLISPVTWNNYSTPPIVTNGQNVVSNSATASQMFFRLSP